MLRVMLSIKQTQTVTGHNSICFGVIMAKKVNLIRPFALFIFQYPVVYTSLTFIIKRSTSAFTVLDFCDTIKYNCNLVCHKF